jgi:hypothetical protein
MRSVVELKQAVDQILENYRTEINPAKDSNKSGWKNFKQRFSLAGGSFFKGSAGRVRADQLQAVADASVDKTPVAFLNDLFVTAVQSNKKSLVSSVLAEKIIDLIAAEVNIKRRMDTVAVNRMITVPGSYAPVINECNDSYFDRICQKISKLSNVSVTPVNAI